MSAHAASISPLLAIMTSAARKAAHAVMRDFREVEQLQVSVKGPADFVSSADLNADRILRELLARARPEFGMITEEGEAVIGADREHCWIVDPIDGSMNFLHGMPVFAVSIALAYRGAPVCGVTYDPCRDECFYGEKGRGAYLNGKRLRVSARKSLGEALLAAPGVGRGKGQRERVFAEMGALAEKVAGLRASGSAALNLAYVAAGRLDGCWMRDIHVWDMAAGILLVREAGGMASEPDGGEKMLESGAILAATAELHLPLVQSLRAAAG